MLRARSAAWREAMRATFRTPECLTELAVQMQMRRLHIPKVTTLCRKCQTGRVPS